MNRRKGIIAVIVASVGLGVAALPAAAELHSVTVVLVTGQRITTTVDVPPATPVSQIQIPGITGAIALVIDNGVIPTPAPSAAPTAHSVPAGPGATATPDGNEKPGAPNRTEGGSGGSGGSQSGNATSPTGNQKVKAGNTHTKKIVSRVERAKQKAKPKAKAKAKAKREVPRQ